MASCKYCSATITWTQNYNDDWVPLAPDGMRHRCLKHQGTHPEYLRGFEAGLRFGSPPPNPFEGLDLLDLIKLCHPDMHPEERQGLANRVTAKLLAIRGASAGRR